MDLSGAEKSFPKEQKLMAVNIGGMLAITAWGIVYWDYFTTDMRWENEGWFSENTKAGGADKLGHFYSSYSVSHICAYTFNKWGYSFKQGAFLGSMSSFVLMSWMEIGDSFSSYGFSYEDFSMNLFGCLTGYYMAVNPELSKRIDLRIEYLPDFKTADFLTDYENIKYILAFKLGGFDFIKNKAARYLEVHLGYYARGYHDRVDSKRNVSIGVGVNLSEIFNNFSMKKTSKIAEYIQIPYTYISVADDLNN